MHDWLGPIPRFPDKSFEHTFCIKHAMVDNIINNLAKCNSSWRQIMQSRNTFNLSPCQVSLWPEDALLWSFCLDYFQMGESMLRICLSKLTWGMVECDALANVYLQSPNKLDARNIARLHEWVHKIPGMMGSLDVTKVHWKNFPNA